MAAGFNQLMHLRAPTVTETEHCAATDCNHTETYATSSGRPFISNKIFIIIRLIAINQMNGLGLLESAAVHLDLDDLRCSMANHDSQKSHVS